jgi:uncharacterized membrane protein HdeD (DUF308 family)
MSENQFVAPGRSRWVWACICFLFGALAFMAPIWPGNAIEHYLGELLIWVGIVEIYDGFKRLDWTSRISTRRSALLSFLMAIILINAILFQARALYLFIIGVFAIDAIRYLWIFFLAKRGKTLRWFDLFAGVGNVVVVGSLLFWEGQGQTWLLTLAVGLRIVGIGFTVLLAKTGKLDQVDEDVAAKIGLTGNPQVAEITARIKLEEEQSASHDRRWIITFILILFVIHLGRMGFDRSYLGILSPVVATIGDMVIALVVTYIIVAPLRLLLLKLMRKRAQRLWGWVSQVDAKDRRWYSPRGLVATWLSYRIRAEVRFIKVGYSLPTAIRTGLKVGLPWAALLVAVMPVLGMSWYFDTENWASGIWDKWAANRADTWRIAMIESSGEGLGPAAFRLQPPQVNTGEDFSFVVIGDTGEGDASQLVLKDQLLEVTNRPEVKFVVISSDVVYPTGALRDYEKKFWMPFKGVTKPVYAIPGNHDWYDALDGFVATFFEPESARKALTARVESDLKLTSTTQEEIERIMTKTEFWRQEYKVPTGHQKAPFFQVSTDDFVLITLETGVERQIDSLQGRWLVNVLDASRGKFVMVILGHPFYAIGEYQGILNPRFDALHDLLRSYNVPLVMGGDTHDLEYYQEPYPKGDAMMHHFVNGGGGAYLSIGAQMADPGTMPTKEYAFYPSREPLTKKIEDNTAWYKRPAWWWATQLNGWPFSSEWLSAMFDYNVAPYFQSFLEIKVQRSQGKVVLIPYSNNGRIRWRDMTSTEGVLPQGAKADDLVEWTIPMN